MHDHMSLHIPAADLPVLGCILGWTAVNKDLLLRLPSLLQSIHRDFMVYALSDVTCRKGALRAVQRHNLLQMSDGDNRDRVNCKIARVISHT